MTSDRNKNNQKSVSIGKLLIAGSPSLGQDEVSQAVKILDARPRQVLSRGSGGADLAGVFWARTQDIPTKVVQPELQKYGKQAEDYRDDAIAEECDAILAIWDGREEATRALMERAKYKGKKIYLWRVRTRPDAQQGLFGGIQE